ncbi:MAG: hypothetical protein JO152_02720, partial [Mycobacteriaceae bacterium]|nr:hypothetical protein [Mycobacteriaceae bacterium]
MTRAAVAPQQAIPRGHDVASALERRNGVTAPSSALLGLFAVGCGAVAAMPVPAIPRAVLLGIFVVIGPGIAVVMRLSLP